MFWTWVSIAVVLSGIYYLVIILNGSLLKHMCHAVTEVSETTGDPITVDECKEGLTKNLMLTDWVFKMLFDSYFAYVIYRWSKSDDAYEKV